MIPWLLIVTGGVMIFAGVKGENPVSVIKGVLTNQTATPPAQPTEPTNPGISPGIQQHLGGS